MGVGGQQHANFSHCQMETILPAKRWYTGMRLHGMELIHNEDIHTWLHHTQNLACKVMLTRLTQNP